MEVFLLQLKELQDEVENVRNNWKDVKGSPYADHLTAVSAAIPALTWSTKVRLCLDTVIAMFENH